MLGGGNMDCTTAAALMKSRRDGPSGRLRMKGETATTLFPAEDMHSSALRSTAAGGPKRALRMLLPKAMR